MVAKHYLRHQTVTLTGADDLGNPGHTGTTTDVNGLTPLPASVPALTSLRNPTGRLLDGKIRLAPPAAQRLMINQCH